MSDTTPPRLAALRRACTAGLAALPALYGLAGAALAQSSVTIYGIVDQGIVKTNTGNTPGAMLPGRGANPGTWSMKAGNTSRLGFRGSEDLGDGRYARFQIEHRFAMDTGLPSNANVFWLGRSVVALGSKSMGEVYAGREYSAAYWVALNADPTLWSYVSQLGSAYTYANYTPLASSVEASNIRWANQVGYKTPSVAGFSAEIASALGEGVRKRAASGNVQFRQGKAWAGVAFDRLDSKTNLVLAAGHYDFGAVRPGLSYARAEGGLNGNASAYSVSVLVPTGFGRAYAMLGAYRPQTQLDSNMFGSGVQLDLSKRTLVYTNLGTARRTGSTRTTAVDFGIKHTF